ncbi:3-keto-disaccharide hydrolase [Dyadobacter sp.]|uniref:3-keto-disaccharide hydrolase n=1 Tax=Dyadobacter sp. TaxID=1914288 RepID=UPI003F6E9B73
MKLQLTMLFSLLWLSVSAQKNADKQEWKQLFNGKNLDGWDIKIRGYELNDNYNNTFRVEDGKMVVRYDQYDDFKQKYGHIFYKGDFSYYRISVEYRFVGEQAPKGEGWAWRNSGIMVHGQPAATMGKDQDFPASIEVQLLGGNDKVRTTCNLCTPGTNVVMDGKLITQHCITSKSKTYNGDQWVKAEVLVLGDSLIQHFANGEMVLEYNKPQLGGGNVSGNDPSLIIEGKLLDHGSISLQSESHPVEFRKVEILDLKGCMDPKATNYKSYFVKADNAKCSYGKKK